LVSDIPAGDGNIEKLFYSVAPPEESLPFGYSSEFLINIFYVRIILIHIIINNKCFCYDLIWLSKQIAVIPGHIEIPNI
jgi:hypothetical protein